MAAAAAETAAIAANGQHLRPGPVMANRFIFDRPNIHRRDDPVRQVVQGAVAVHMRLAKPPLAMVETAAPKTQVAACFAGFRSFLQSCGH